MVQLVLRDHKDRLEQGLVYGADGAPGADGQDGAQGPQGPAGNDGARWCIRC